MRSLFIARFCGRVPLGTLCCLFALILWKCGDGNGVVLAEEPAKIKWLQAKAYAIPKETTSEGSGYFAIVAGKNERLYIGTAKYRENAYLVEFEPKSETMKVVVDAHREIGSTATGFAAQAKIHTRNNTGASGKIYFATKQGYPTKEERRDEYPGGYPMVYDPATGKTRVYSIPVAHHGIISITPDESRGVAYISTCDDNRPVESTHFMVLNLETGEYRDLLDCQHMYAFIVVDYRGRAYHPILGGDIARFDPATQQLERLKQTIDSKPPTAESNLAHPQSHPINWDISPDGKTLYAVPLSTNQMYAYDLTAAGDTLAGRSLGPLVAGASNADCRAMCVGPTGDVWCALTVRDKKGVNVQHLVRYRAGDQAPKDFGPVAVSNPDYTPFFGNDGKPLPYHGGLQKMEDGSTTTKHVILGVCQTPDGSVYSLALQPYTLLRVGPEQLK